MDHPHGREGNGRHLQRHWSKDNLGHWRNARRHQASDQVEREVYLGERRVSRRTKGSSVGRYAGVDSTARRGWWWPYIDQHTESSRARSDISFAVRYDPDDFGLVQEAAGRSPGEDARRHYRRTRSSGVGGLAREASLSLWERVRVRALGAYKH